MMLVHDRAKLRGAGRREASKQYRQELKAEQKVTQARLRRQGKIDAAQ